MGMIRPIRVDHTNFFQVAIRTHSIHYTLFTSFSFLNTLFSQKFHDFNGRPYMTIVKFDNLSYSLFSLNLCLSVSLSLCLSCFDAWAHSSPPQDFKVLCTFWHLKHWFVSGQLDTRSLCIPFWSPDLSEIFRSIWRSLDLSGDLEIDLDFSRLVLSSPTFSHLRISPALIYSSLRSSTRLLAFSRIVFISGYAL